MVGDKRVIDALNKNLASEHSAILQYVTHSSICSNWGFDVLANYLMQRAKEEMKHLDMLVDRILFLEGEVVPSGMDTIHIGKKVEEMFDLDEAAEDGAIESYNEAIKLCTELKDTGTRVILESILADEERHLDDIAKNIVQIEMLGIKTYLAENIKD